MSRQLLVLPDEQSLAAEGARRFAVAAISAMRERGRFAVALPGGSTPFKLYKLLAQSPHETIPWARTQVFFGDERCVPPDHEWSNFRSAHENLLAHIPMAQENVFRMRGEDEPEAAARAYACQLSTTLGSEMPSLDLILLGMGEDGHTASLFPGMPALGVRDRIVVASEVPAYVTPDVARLTLTLPVLEAAREVIFLVAGARKAEAVAAVWAREGALPQLPAAQVQGLRAQVTWLVDDQAATRLRRGAEDGTPG